MKHWHRCSRWRERFEECPFRGRNHEDDEGDGEAEDELRLERGGAPVGARPLPIRPQPVPAEVGIPVPDPIHIAVPDDPPAGIPVTPPGRPEVAGIPFPQEEGIAEVVKVLVEAISQVPARWRPTDSQLAEITAKLGMAKQASRADVITASAEAEAVSAFSVTSGVGLDKVWPVAVIPLLKHLAKARAGARAGVVGRPGRMDPPRATSTFRTGFQKPGIAMPRPGARGPSMLPQFRPPVSFPAMSINMAARMKQLMSLSPRRKIGGTEL